MYVAHLSRMETALGECSSLYTGVIIEEGMTLLGLLKGMVVGRREVVVVVVVWRRRMYFFTSSNLLFVIKRFSSSQEHRLLF